MPELTVVEGIENFSVLEHDPPTVIKCSDAGDFDQFVLIVAKQLLSVRHHGDVEHTGLYEDTDDIWAPGHETTARKHRKSVPIAEKFDIKPVRAAFDYVNHRIFAANTTRGYLNKASGQQVPRYRNGVLHPEIHRPYVETVSIVALVDLALKGSKEVAGVAGIDSRVGFGASGYKHRAVTRLLGHHVAIGSTPRELYPQVLTFDI